MEEKRGSRLGFKNPLTEAGYGVNLLNPLGSRSVGGTTVSYDIMSKTSNVGIQIGDTIQFQYTNWRGITAMRTATVRGFRYGTTEYHKDAQWLLEAYDVEKTELRQFAMSDMSEVRVSRSR